jgi:agmatinase
MRPTLAVAVLAGGLLRSAAAHDHHDEIAHTQEPFIGWTQEDLDAKWGTDVCSTNPISIFCN